MRSSVGGTTGIIRPTAFEARLERVVISASSMARDMTHITELNFEAFTNAEFNVLSTTPWLRIRQVITQIAKARQCLTIASMPPKSSARLCTVCKSIKVGTIST